MSELSRLTDVYLEIDGSARLSDSLTDAVNQACSLAEDARKEVTVLVRLGGAGAAAAGEAWPHDLCIHSVNQWERALRRLERLPAVTLAVVEGACTGPALDVLLTTHYRLCTLETRLGIALVAGSTWPGMALYRLANQIGPARARRLALFGDEVSAVCAAELGIVDEVVDDAVARTREVLSGFAGISGTELSIRRHLLAEATSNTFEDAVGAHLAACDRALRLARSGQDAASGMPEA